MNLQISQIKSVELDRSKPFHHVIRLKDANGHSLEVIPVNESTGYEQFKAVYIAWASHESFNPKTKKG